MNKLENIFRKPTNRTDNLYGAVYKPVPLTRTLLKRKYEEEQFAKYSEYGVAKEKSHEFF